MTLRSMIDSVLRRFSKRGFDNRRFWNERYATNDALGSGVGSRGAVLDYKRELLRQLAAENPGATILDIGCGDMELGSVLPAEGYTGVDVSDVAIQRNIVRFPDRRFASGDVTQLSLQPADLVLCFDVLIHIPTRETYEEIVRRIVQLSRRGGVVAAYSEAPKLSSITFYYEPIETTLMRLGATNVRRIGDYHQVAVVRFDSPVGAQAR